MTTINPVSAATTVGGSAATAAGSANDAADRFMTLLVAQMKNQDPLNPLDNAQLTSQLAQINTVSGINKLNDTMTSLAASLSANQSLQAVGLVGHTAQVPGNLLALAGGKGGGGYTMPGAADGAAVTIRDAAGAVVRTLDLGAVKAGSGTFAWDGTTAAGSTAPDGVYTFSVAGTAAGVAVTGAPLMQGKVVGLAAGTGGTQLDLGALGRFDLGQVVEIN